VIETVQNVHEGRLACPILAQQGMDLPLAQVKVNVIISQDARELLRDTPGF